MWTFKQIILVWTLLSTSMPKPNSNGVLCNGGVAIQKYQNISKTFV